MTNEALHFEHDGLVIDIDDAGDTTTVRWKGIGDARDPGAHLSPFFATVVPSLSGKAVLVDFREFEYMNSAMVSPLIHFVKNLDAAGARTTLLFDTSVPWQKANAQCMRAIARTLSNVQVP